jgi:hypothetical protein
MTRIAMDDITVMAALNCPRSQASPRSSRNRLDRAQMPRAHE